jgi:riboflavin kinase / FMN adenylyltransferase
MALRGHIPGPGPRVPVMTVLPWDGLRPSLIDSPVRLTIGVFDGLHIGHQKLMEAITSGAGDAVPLVITFRGSPAAFLSPDRFRGFILSHPQKLARLEERGIRTALLIDFSEEMSNLSGRAFIGLLKENLTIQKIVVGYNFRFGKSRNAGNDDLKEIFSGTRTDVHVTEPVRWDGQIVSSSRIREAIQDARFEAARAMLGRDFALDLRDCPRSALSGARVGIARRDIHQVLPRAGEYAVRCESAARDSSGRCTIDDEWVVVAGAPSDDITTVVFT